MTVPYLRSKLQVISTHDPMRMCHRGSDYVATSIHPGAEEVPRMVKTARRPEVPKNQNQEHLVGNIRSASQVQ